MKIKMLLFVLITSFIQAYAMKPTDYDYDRNGCIKCISHALSKIDYVLEYYTRKHTPATRVYLAVCENDTGKLESALADGGNIDDACIDVLTSHASVAQLKMVLDHGANPNCVDIQGHTPAHIATLTGNAPNLALLIQYGAQLDDSYILNARRLRHTNCLQVLEDAPLLRQQKIEYDRKLNQLLAQERRKQKKEELNALLAQSALARPSVINDASSIIPSSVPPSPSSQAHKQTLEDEHTKNVMRQQQKYNQEFQAGKLIARQKRLQLKQARFKK